MDKVSNLGDFGVSQIAQITQQSSSTPYNKSGHNIKSLTDFLSKSTIRNKKIYNLTSRTGFWTNQNAVLTATISNLPSKTQIQQIANMDHNHITNSKNLQEELQGTIYNQDKFNDKQNLYNDVENLEKWLYDHTESLKRELTTGSRKKLQNYGNKYE